MQMEVEMQVEIYLQRENQGEGRTEHKPKLGKLTQREDMRRGEERHGKNTKIMQSNAEASQRNTEDATRSTGRHIL